MSRFMKGCEKTCACLDKDYNFAFGALAHVGCEQECLDCNIKLDPSQKKDEKVHDPSLKKDEKVNNSSLKKDEKVNEHERFLAHQSRGMTVEGEVSLAYYIYRSMISLFSIFVSFKCNGGFSLGGFLTAILMPEIYLIYQYATRWRKCFPKGFRGGSRSYSKPRKYRFRRGRSPSRTRRRSRSL